MNEPQGRPAPAADPPPSPRGILFGLAAASTFALVTVFARLAYDGGSDPYTVTTIRSIVNVLAIAALIPIWRESLFIPRHVMPAFLVVTLTRFGTSITIMVAILFIPVGLAAILLYTYPLMIALYTSVRDRSPLGAVRWACFFVAFAGLGLAIGPAFDILDWRGIALSLLTAVNVAIMLVVSQNVLRHTTVMGLSFWSTLGTVPLFFVALAIAGGFVWPTADSGWIGFWGVSACFTVAVITQFAAVHFVGPVRTAMLLNTEPVVTVIAAFLILGEELTPLQYIGAALVVGALLVFNRMEQRLPRAPSRA